MALERIILPLISTSAVQIISNREIPRKNAEIFRKRQFFGAIDSQNHFFEKKKDKTIIRFSPGECVYRILGLDIISFGLRGKHIHKYMSKYRNSPKPTSRGFDSVIGKPVYQFITIIKKKLLTNS